MDVDKYDYKEEGYFKTTQETQLAIIEDRWLDDYKVRIYKDQFCSTADYFKPQGRGKKV